MADDHPSSLTSGSSAGSSATLPPPRFQRSHARRNIVIVAVVVVLIVGGFFLWRYLGSYESTDDAQVDAHLYPVSARVSGYVTKVSVDDNQPVEQGAVLVEIDPRDYQVAVEQAKAALASAEATAQSLNITVPITTVSTGVQKRLACGRSSVNGKTPRIEPQITYLRPNRSPRYPPTMVPAATENRKRKRCNCALCTDKWNLPIR